MNVHLMTAAGVLASSVMFGFGGRAEAAVATTPCETNVVRQGNALIVSPSGGDDTAAVQCALDSSDGVVKLEPGVFRVGTIVANGFTGRFVGSGAERTLITNLDAAVPVTANDYFENAPSAENPWPFLLSFVDGSFTISDLAIHVSGEEPTTGWSSHGFFFRAFAGAITITGTAARATLERLSISGEPSPEAFGVNVINAVYTWGAIGADPHPLSIRYSVKACEFSTVGSALPVANLVASDVSINANRFDGTVLAAEITDIADTRYVFAGNAASTLGPAFEQWDFFSGPNSVSGVRGSTIQISGNRVAGGPILFHGTFLDDVRCAITGNTFGAMADWAPADVILDAGIHGCLVAGQADVLDVSGDNRVAP